MYWPDQNLKEKFCMLFHWLSLNGLKAKASNFLLILQLPNKYLKILAIKKDSDLKFNGHIRFQ